MSSCTQWCKFLQQEVREKHRHFVALSRPFPLSLLRGEQSQTLHNYTPLGSCAKQGARSSFAPSKFNSPERNCSNLVCNGLKESRSMNEVYIIEAISTPRIRWSEGVKSHHVYFPLTLQGVPCPRGLDFVDLDLGCSTILLRQ